jgi:flagellar hook-basal body complex protein FliE
VLAVARARLSMQLAAQIRTKVVESVNDIFHTQV